MITPSQAPPPLPSIPPGALTMRATQKILGKTAYQVLKLIAEGELEADKVHNSASETHLQVRGESVAAYLHRQQGAR